MSDQQNGELVLDIRGGCVAIYRGEPVNCLSGASDWAIHYAHGRHVLDGNGNWTGTWEVPPEKLENAKRIYACLKACDGIPAMVLERPNPVVYREQVGASFFQAFHAEWNARDAEGITQDFGQAIHDRMMKALFPTHSPSPERAPHG